jgi:cytochrome c
LSPLVRRCFTVALLSLAAGVGAAKSQDTPGQVLFNNACRTCHTLRPGDNRLGPHLYAIVGRRAGSLPDYAYSDAMRRSGLVWDEETLETFIENPEAVVPGNSMKPYTSVVSPEMRAAIIDHLKANGSFGSIPVQQ